LKEGSQRRPEDQGRRLCFGKAYLPAISAVSAISAAPAAATMATSATAATTMATASAAITTAATPAATTATLSLRPRLVYHQVPAAEILAVQGVDRAVSIFIALHFDEGKTARLSRETVTNQIDARGSNANLREPFLKLLFRRRKRKIPDVELLHLPTPSARNPSESRGAR
jgi:hypothetical protein